MRRMFRFGTFFGKALPLLCVVLLPIFGSAMAPNPILTRGKAVYTSRGNAPYLADDKFMGTTFDVTDGAWIAIQVGLSPEPKLEVPTGLAESRFDMIPRRSGFLINLGSGSLIKVPQGMAGIELFDVSGKRVWSIGHLKAGDAFGLPAGIGGGAFRYRWVSR